MVIPICIAGRDGPIQRAKLVTPLVRSSDHRRGATVKRAVAGLAVQVGARTAVIGRDRHEIDEIVNTLAGGPGELVAVVSDVCDHRSVICAAKAVEQRFGHIDALVYCAGFGAVADVMESTLADHETMMDVNHFGGVRWTKSVLPRMLEQRHGDIVLIASDGALRSFPGWSAYCASKHAMLGFARCCFFAQTEAKR